MRVMAIATVVAFCVLAPASGGGVRESGNPASLCGFKRGEELLLTKEVRVVGRINDSLSETWACLRPGFRDSKRVRERGYRKRLRVERHGCRLDCEGRPEPPDLAVTGAYVAYAHGPCEAGRCAARMGVVNVKTARRAATVFERSNQVAGLAVAPSGTAVWIVGQTCCPATPPEVAGITVRGKELLFDKGDIDVSSLALTGQRLYWMRAGAQQTTVVP